MNFFLLGLLLLLVADATLTLFVDCFEPAAAAAAAAAAVA